MAYLETFQFLDTRRIAVNLRHSLSVIAFFAVAIPMLFYDPSWSHPGYITLVPVFGALLFILSRADALVNRNVLACVPMTFIGLISYSLYLWHWPLLSYLNICFPNPPFYLCLLVIVASFICATAIYYYVENPVRRSQFVFRYWKIKLPLSAILIIILILVGLCGYGLRKTEGLPERTINHEFPTLVNIRQGVSWSKEPYIESGNLRIYGVSENIPEILFVGDSHAVQYYYRMKFLSQSKGKTAGMVQASGCFMLAGGDKEECRKASVAFYEIMKSSNVKTLVLVNKWGGRYNQTYFDQGIENLKKLLNTRKDLELYVLLDPPWDEGKGGAQGNFDPLKHFNRFGEKNQKYMLEYTQDGEWRRGNDAITAALEDYAVIINTEQFVCPHNQCDVLKWYMDDDHLQPKRLEKEATWIDLIFN